MGPESMRASFRRAEPGESEDLACLSEDQVMAVLAGDLDPAAFRKAENHFDACRLCRLLVSTLAGRTCDGTARRQVSAFAPGDLVADRYEISALLGVGGMGEVYAAFDRVLGEGIALKSIAPGTSLGDGGMARLKAEVQFARRVTHRNVCRVFDVGFHVEPAGDRAANETIAVPFLTMELLAGETLRSYLRSRSPIPLTEVLAIVEQMAAGLDAAHAAGIVHSDLKSENVMLVPEPDGFRVAVTDFGLARALPQWARGGGTAGAALLQSGGHRRVAGTLGYMAPEQLSGRPIGPASDIYALGVVTFELITGDLPFSPPDLVAGGAEALGLERPPVQFRNEVPRHWQSAVRRCLDPSPAGRYQRAGELVAAMRFGGAASRARRLSSRLAAIWRRWRP